MEALHSQSPERRVYENSNEQLFNFLSRVNYHATVTNINITSGDEGFAKVSVQLEINQRDTGVHKEGQYFTLKKDNGAWKIWIIGQG